MTSPETAPPEKAANRDSFYYTGSVRLPKGSSRPLLLWRIVQARQEVQDGRLQVLKKTFLAHIRDSEDDFTEYNPSLVGNIKKLLESAGRTRVDQLARVALEVASAYRKEIMSVGDTAGQISFDILFQTIQILALNPTRESAEQTIMQMGRRAHHTALSEQDRGRLMRSFRAYIYLARRLARMRNMRAALESQDEIIVNAYRDHPEVSLIFLDRAYRSLVAQVILSKKFKCDTLLVEWLKEYGLGPEHMMRVAQYIPFETGFWKFRASYRDAVRSLRDYTPDSGEPLDSDLFLLRSLGIFYTSWIMQTSRQIPAA